MLELLAAMMAHTASGPPTPSVVSVVAGTTNSGTCVVGSHIPRTSASYDVTVTLANMDFSTYEVKLYENSVLKQTYTAGPIVYSVTVTGAVEGGTYTPFTVNRTYRADIVNKTTGVVVNSGSGNWTQRYGGCP